TEIGQEVSRLQRTLRDLTASATPARTTPSSDLPARTATAAADAGRTEGFTLPDWVDQVLFEEFLAAQVPNMSAIEADILAIEEGRPDAVDTLKRRLHNLKGEAGVLGLGALEQVCHRFEDALLSEKQAPRDLTDAFLSAHDWMDRALKSYAAGSLPGTKGTELFTAGERSGATAPSSPRRSPPPAQPEPPPEPSPAHPEPSPAQPGPRVSPAGGATPAPDATQGPDAWDEDMLDLVGDFLQECKDGLAQADELLLEASRRQAEAEEINALFRVFHTIKGTSSFLNLQDVTQVAHTTESMLNRVREGTLELTGAILDGAFDATALLRTLIDEVRVAAEGQRPVRANGAVGAFLDLCREIQARPRTENAPLPRVPANARVGDVLKRQGVPEPVVERAAAVAQQRELRIGEQLIEEGVVSPKDVARGMRAIQATANAPRLKETVSVDLGRIDHLVEMVGELVIVEAMITNAPEFTEHSTARSRAYLAQFAKIARDIQRMGMQLRMVPLRAVFQKMGRIVRDVSRKSQKNVHLVLSGETTEMDRNMVQGLADPLVHMIRNAVDHGMESPEERAAAGKPVEGTIWLSAYHEGGHIAIEVRDDGRGLNRARILEKAIAKGLVTEGQELSDGDINKLIFAPGFSTAAQVTEISGRGVGMDVVKRNIEAMRGHIVVHSAPGEGTTIKIILPLTLAIIDGMLVTSGTEQYIVPLLAIVESIQPTPSMIVSVRGSNQLLNFRGEILPLVWLSRLFHVQAAKTEPCKGLVIVLESVGHRVGLLVDDVVTQQQVVIKNLGPVLHGTPYISGATILSDGHVGLILNVEELVQRQVRSERDSSSEAE
ncbi:MAG: Hpt domain-containing protein, partial [Deltaproteobacteria bacterium]|nr:Hpt domain-containing protein [Deltaproteobacteria bacterium]